MRSRILCFTAAAAAASLLMPGCGPKRADNVAQAADSTADAIANRAESVRRTADALTANVEGMPDDGAGNQAEAR